MLVTKGSLGLFMESTLTLKEVLVTTSMLYAPKMLNREEERVNEMNPTTAVNKSPSRNNPCEKESLLIHNPSTVGLS